jgi:hypothetical protein
MNSVQRDAGVHAIGEKVTIHALTAGAFYQISNVKIKTVSIVIGHELFAMGLNRYGKYCSRLLQRPGDPTKPLSRPLIDTIYDYHKQPRCTRQNPPIA